MAYCEYNHSDTVGFCVGGPDEPATNADGTRPTSIAQCWAACTTSYGSELKAIDFWPNLANTAQRRGSCFCQTACTYTATPQATTAATAIVALFRTLMMTMRTRRRLGRPSST